MKVLRIEKCWQCYHKSAFSPYVCTISKIWIDDVFHGEIPSWCRLPDVPNKSLHPNPLVQRTLS